MKHLKAFENFDQNREKMQPLEEGFWSSLFGKQKKGSAPSEKTPSKEDNYVVFDGKKFYPDQIEYDSMESTKPVPRVEGNTLIVANPMWNQ